MGLIVLALVEIAGLRVLLDLAAYLLSFRITGDPDGCHQVAGGGAVVFAVLTFVLLGLLAGAPWWVVALIHRQTFPAVLGFLVGAVAWWAAIQLAATGHLGTGYCYDLQLVW